jgi:hypothetical protein
MRKVMLKDSHEIFHAFILKLAVKPRLKKIMPAKSGHYLKKISANIISQLAFFLLFSFSLLF